MKHYRENAKREVVECYGLRYRYTSFIPCLSSRDSSKEVEKLLLKLRKAAIVDREDHLKSTKETSDRDLKKYYGRLAKDQLKLYRAICLYIPFFCADPPGDCPFVYWTEWSVDLEEELDAVGRLIEITSWEESDNMKKEEAKTKRDTSGNLLIRGKCSVCKQCWIYMAGPMKGQCEYGGPYAGYEKQPEVDPIEAHTVSEVRGPGERSQS